MLREQIENNETENVTSSRINCVYAIYFRIFDGIIVSSFIYIVTMFQFNDQQKKYSVFIIQRTSYDVKDITVLGDYFQEKTKNVNIVNVGSASPLTDEKCKISFLEQLHL